MCQLALFCFAVLGNFYAACVALVFIGGFIGILESTASSILAELNPNNSGFYITLSQVFFGLGALIGPLIAGIILSAGISWRLTYFILCFFSLIITAVLIYINPVLLKTSDSITLSSFKRLITDKKFLLICLCMFLYTGSEVGSWSWISTFLKESIAFSAFKSSVVLFVFWTAMILGRLLCGHLTIKFRTTSMIIILAYLSTSVTFISGAISGEIAIFLVIAAMGFTYSGQWPLIVSYGSSQYSTAPATVFSLMIGSGSMGSALIPYLMGIIGEHISIRAAMISPAILLLLVGLIFTSFRLRSN